MRSANHLAPSVMWSSPVSTRKMMFLACSTKGCAQVVKLLLLKKLRMVKVVVMGKYFTLKYVKEM